MLTVIFGSTEVPVAEATEGWIGQQLGRGRREGASVCVQVAIATADLRMRLSTPHCASGAPGRAPTPLELRILELWTECGLSDADFAARQPDPISAPNTAIPVVPYEVWRGRGHIPHATNTCRPLAETDQRRLLAPRSL
jgi:hypothetical protein